MTGHRVGKLTVIKRANDDRPGAWWKCRCDCGRSAIVIGSKLRRGAQKSCGCLKQRGAELGAATVVDMLGYRIGRLTVIARAGSLQVRSDESLAVWRCRC